MLSTSPVATLEKSAMRKAMWRIVPFIIACYFFAYLDRVNVGIAALQMNDAIGLSAEAFGFGSGIFFVGYFIFEVPSNMFLERFGARRWIARIMVTWGILAGCMVFASGPVFYSALRFLLGLAEAGFYPGIILYITYFFPKSYRGRVIAIFTTGVPLSVFLGSPVSTLLLELHGLMGLEGWQWMFLMEALPSVLLGVACLWVLSDSPREAKWLAAEEREWLEQTLQAERLAQTPGPRRRVWSILADPRVLACAFVYAGVAASSIGLAVWQPQIIKSHGLSNIQAGFLSAVPYGVAVVGMILWARMSDKSLHRAPYVLIPLLVITFSLASLGAIDALSLTVLGLSLAVMSTYAFKGPFWAFVTETFDASEVAVILAHINAIGGLGSFLGSWAFGVVKGATGSYALGLLPIVALTALGALTVALISTRARRRARALGGATPGTAQRAKIKPASS
ncbi:MFS transporter [Pseudomonas typographi]|uniref:MFS transporter n=1 Tax=Pseudomonas typographi TaxID=2715964 RepID=UPI00168571BA|nr:MFS transporter [Pseudomonas typographi]